MGDKMIAVLAWLVAVAAWIYTSANHCTPSENFLDPALAGVLQEAAETQARWDRYYENIQ